MEESIPFATDSASAVRLETGRRVRQRRQQLNISVADLAEGLGVSRESIYGYEAGSRAVNSYDLPRLGQLLKVPISFLFGEFILWGTETPTVGTWVRPDHYPTAGRFSSEQVSIVLSEAEMEVLGIMRGLSSEGQDFVQAFTRMVQEREISGKRKIDFNSDATGNRHQPRKPEGDAQEE